MSKVCNFVGVEDSNELNGNQIVEGNKGVKDRQCDVDEDVNGERK